MKRDNLFHNNKFWVLYQHILSLIKVPQMQGRSGYQYLLDKNDYMKITSIIPKNVR